MRDTMIESLPVTVADAYRPMRRPVAFDLWRKPPPPPPLEKRDGAFKPEPLYAPVPLPRLPDPARERPDDAREPESKPRRGVKIYDM